MKNYRVKFIDKSHVDLTAEEAAKVIQAWSGGTQVFIFNGGGYATHQICSIAPIRGQELKDLISLGNNSKVPKLEDYLSPNQLKNG